MQQCPSSWLCPPSCPSGMRRVTGEGYCLVEVLPGGLETGPILTCSPETQTALKASLRRGVSTPLGLSTDGAGCQESWVSLGSSQYLLTGNGYSWDSLIPRQLEKRWEPKNVDKEEEGK